MASRKITDLSNVEAKRFFKEVKSYINFDLPFYFDFTGLLAVASGLTFQKELNELCRRKDNNKIDSPKDYEGVDYILLSNKDGAFAWRPLELIHPVLYMDLVNTITEIENWKLILSRFADFSAGCVKCISIPRIAVEDESNKAAQIRYWWEEIEQRSIKMAMTYNYVFSTDITNCYGSIYTHSIEWALALGGKAEVKRVRESGLRTGVKSLGAQIDEKIRNMNYGQTNGIPQGSNLMDFIAEIVLGYSDLQLTDVLKDIPISEYQILRYRDDYRIFVNNPVIGYRILKELSSILYGLGLKMNLAKTFESDDIILSSIKKEKLEIISIAPAQQHFQREALRIYQLSKKYPNAGVVQKELSLYFDRINLRLRDSDIVDFEVLVSIFTMIALSSPGTIGWVAAIVSQILPKIKNKAERDRLVEDIHIKFKRIPNTGFIDIWLQRISKPLGLAIEYDDQLAKAATSKIKMSQIWESSWLDSVAVSALDSMSISDLNEKLQANQISPVITREEVELFKLRYN